jgi:hypothetical protein
MLGELVRRSVTNEKGKDNGQGSSRNTEQSEQESRDRIHSAETGEEEVTGGFARLGDEAFDPGVNKSPSVGEKGLACEECAQPFEDLRNSRRGRRFCSSKCRYRHRDRRRYELDPEGEREKSRRYYAANRERVIARVTMRKKPPGKDDDGR